MPTVLDTTRDCSPVAAALKQQGYDTVIRYYSRSAWKRLTPREAVALGRAGLRIAAVYQNRQNCAEDFTEAKGRAAGAHAYDYAENVIFQPPGSGVFFSVDYDATAADVEQRIAPYFAGVRAAFHEAAGGGEPAYRIGVYGSGRTCRLLKAAGLVDLGWLAQATGWAEFERHYASNQWHLKQNMPGTVCGLDCDTNETNPALSDFGAFLLDPDALGPAAPPAEPMAAASRSTVIARDGLRLRAGPSVDFDVRSLLPFGSAVVVLSRTGDWSLVDLNGDGAADGFCHSSFLQPA